MAQLLRMAAEKQAYTLSDRGTYLAQRQGLRVHELAPIAASLEDAFMEMTQDEVEYRPSTLAGAIVAGPGE